MMRFWAIEKEKVADTIGLLLDVYVEHRQEQESFLDTYRRLGIDPYKQRVYPKKHSEKKVTASAAY